MSERVSDRAAIACSLFLSLSLSSAVRYASEMIIIEAAATGDSAGVRLARSGLHAQLFIITEFKSIF
jgi:hypothetical protein